MSKTMWVCEKCNSSYDTEEQAEQCEQAHPAPGDLEVVGCRFGQKAARARSESEFVRKRVPGTIVVRWGKNHGEVAEYRLNHVGPRGL